MGMARSPVRTVPLIIACVKRKFVGAKKEAIKRDVVAVLPEKGAVAMLATDTLLMRSEAASKKNPEIA